MINLVFDMSNMFFRSMHIIGGFKSTYSFDNKRELDELMRKMATDITFLIRLVNQSRVILATDEKSWRKTIKIEENEGYKANREKSDHINWDNVYSILDEFLEIAKHKGVTVSKVKMAEADDLISLWSDYFLDKNQNVITVSGDEDVRQVVRSIDDDKGGKVFSTVFNPFKQGKASSRKLYVPSDFMEWLESEDTEVDIWNMSSTINVDKQDFKKIKDSNQLKIEEVNGAEIRIRKIICGDDGDNIPAAYTWIRKTAKGEEKETRTTKGVYNKIYNELSELYENVDYNTLLENENIVKKHIQNAAKHEPTINIKDRLKRQIKLVVLNKSVFPERIVEDFNEHVLDANENIKLNERLSSMNMRDFLMGTRFIKKSSGGTNKGYESTIFKEIDRMSQNKELF